MKTPTQPKRKKGGETKRKRTTSVETPSDSIYLTREGETFGPYSSGQIAAMAETHAISLTDLAWCDGMDQWMPLNQIVDLPSHEQTAPPDQEAGQDDEMTEEDFTLFVGKRSAYYLKHYNASQQKWSFKMAIPTGNKAAFWLNFAWFAYRKMYLYSIAITFVTLLLAWSVKSFTGSGAGAIPLLLVCFLANPLYFRHARKTVLGIKSRFSDRATQCQLIREAGGTSVAGLAIGLAVLLLCLACAVYDDNDSHADATTPVAASSTDRPYTTPAKEASNDDVDAKFMAILQQRFDLKNGTKLDAIPVQFLGRHGVVAIQTGKEEPKTVSDGEKTIEIASDSALIIDSRITLKHFYSGDIQSVHCFIALSDEGDGFAVWEAGHDGEKLGVRFTMQIFGDNPCTYFLK